MQLQFHRHARGLLEDYSDFRWWPSLPERAAEPPFSSELLGLRVRPALHRLDRELAPLIDATSAKHDLILYLQENGDRSELSMEYDTDIIDAATAERWLGYLLRFSDAVIAEPDGRENAS